MDKSTDVILRSMQPFKMPKHLKDATDVAMAACKRVGDPMKLSQPVRTVVVITSAQGVIDNGGMRYFFEQDFPNLPDYSIFVDAYRFIGADSEAFAMAAAVKLFPFADPHLHRSKRNKFLDKTSSELSDRARDPFDPFTSLLCGNKRVWELLERSAKRNKSAFRDLSKFARVQNGG